MIVTSWPADAAVGVAWPVDSITDIDAHLSALRWAIGLQHRYAAPSSERLERVLRAHIDLLLEMRHIWASVETEQVASSWWGALPAPP